MILDHTIGFVPAPHLQHMAAEQCNKFFNDDIYYAEDEVCVRAVIAPAFRLCFSKCLRSHVRAPARVDAVDHLGSHRPNSVIRTQAGVLLRAIQDNTPQQRETFFLETRACRRRKQKDPKNTPLNTVFTMSDYYRCVAVDGPQSRRTCLPLYS